MEQKSSVYFVGNCKTCGYSLARLTINRCPECGRPFDPANRQTMDFNRPRWAKMSHHFGLMLAIIPAAVYWALLLLRWIYQSRVSATELWTAVILTLVLALIVWARWYRRRVLQRTKGTK